MWVWLKEMYGGVGIETDAGGRQPRDVRANQ
jgi:hypothetical protein